MNSVWQYLKRYQTVVKLGVSLALLAWFFSRTDLSLVYRHLASFPKAILGGVFILYLLAQLVRTLKWRLLLPDYPLAALFRMTLMAGYYNLILPGQIAGEGMKVYILGKGSGEAEKIAASVVVDKITGLISLLLVGLAGVMASRARLPRGLGFWFVAVTACLSLGLYSFRYRPVRDLLDRSLTRLARLAPRTQNFCGRLRLFMEAWRRYLHSPRVLCRSLLWGLLFQLMLVVNNFILGAALGLQAALVDFGWIMAISSLAVLIPVTIGGVGLREGSFIILLGWLGITSDQALSLSVLTFAVLLLGAGCGLWVAFRGERKAAEKRRGPGT
jgi:glycosyltransferase 2 family protein